MTSAMTGARAQTPDAPETPLVHEDEGRQGRSRSLLRGVAPAVVAAIIGLAVWEAVSFVSGQWVPSLSEIGGSLASVVTDGETLGEAAVTLRRVAIVTVASITVGVLVGLTSGFFWPIRAFLRPIFVIGLAVPDLVYLIITILILGARESSGLVAMTIAIIPLLINAVTGSVLARDSSLDDMSKAYNFSRMDYARHVVFEQLKPALAAVVVTGFAFSWKLVVLMEALTMPDGIGSRIYQGFRYLRPQDAIAYTIIFILLMKVIEKLLVKPLQVKEY